jgi:glycosyltransferase involved in cell wall biosynthesis
MDPARFTPSVVCINAEGEFFATLTAAGIEARALHLGGKRNAIRALRELVSITRRIRPDVVVMRSYNAEILGRIAARVAGVKHTIMWMHQIGDVPPRSWTRNVADRALTRWTSAYFGLAEAQRPYLVGELGYADNKIRIIPNGVDPQKFDTHADRIVLAEFGISEGDPVVGIVAVLRPEKDHATLLRAARIVIDKLPKARFLVIGDGPMRPELESMCSDLGITSNVHFAGNRADVAQLLCAIDVFTLTSTTVECLPFALLEAMACARPAVCTAVGGIPEMIDHGQSGYLVPQKDQEQLAARLVSLLSDPQTARRMGRAGREYLEAKFTLDRNVAEVQQAIEDVVFGNSSAEAADG